MVSLSRIPKLHNFFVSNQNLTLYLNFQKSSPYILFSKDSTIIPISFSNKVLNPKYLSKSISIKILLPCTPIFKRVPFSKILFQISSLSKKFIFCQTKETTMKGEVVTLVMKRGFYVLICYMIG